MPSLTSRVGLPLFVACSIAGLSHGQTSSVQFRIVERTGQASVSQSDNVVDLAVQARSTGHALNSFGFHVRISGEPEAYGTLARGAISNLDGTYTSSVGVTSSVGRGGLAAQYTFLAQINPRFNGVINEDVNVFANGPDQEILLVTGTVGGSSLLRTPGMDNDADGFPDAWSGNGGGVTPPYWTFAPLDSAISGPYFARNEFIDLYHFRYTVTNLTSRTLHFTLENLTTTTFDQLIYNLGTWGPLGGNRAITGIEPLDIGVNSPIPEPAVVFVVLFAFPANLRRRRVDASRRARP